MANDLNNCSFIGRLGKDPETAATASQTEITSFSIAVGWKSKDKEGTEWVNIKAFGGLAGICSQYLRKGSQVFIAGRFTTESWEKDGIKHYKTVIVADELQMLGGKSDNAGQGQQQSNNFQQPQGGPTDDNNAFDDKIPF